MYNHLKKYNEIDQILYDNDDDTIWMLQRVVRQALISDGN